MKQEVLLDKGEASANGHVATGPLSRCFSTCDVAVKAGGVKRVYMEAKMPEELGVEGT